MRLVLLLSLVAAAFLGGPRQAAAGPPRPDADPCAVDPQPVVNLEPRSGPIGTRIRIRGRCFDPEHDHNAAYGVLLIRQFTRPRACELIADGRQRFDVAADGTGRGHLVVGRKGRCFQRLYRRRVTPARYSMSIGCHACVVRGGSFRVTR